MERAGADNWIGPMAGAQLVLRRRAILSFGKQPAWIGMVERRAVHALESGACQRRVRDAALA